MKGKHKEEERMRRIHEVVATLKEAYKKFGKDKVDEMKFTIEICLRYGVTERKAKEYIRAAKFMIDHGKS